MTQVRATFFRPSFKKRWLAHVLLSPLSSPGFRKQLSDGETGFLVAPGNVSALADALEKLLRNRDLRAQFGAAGKARIEKNFQIQTTIVPLLDLFEQAEAQLDDATSCPTRREQNRIPD